MLNLSFARLQIKLVERALCYNQKPLERLPQSEGPKSFWIDSQDEQEMGARFGYSRKFDNNYAEALIWEGFDARSQTWAPEHDPQFETQH